MFDSDRSRRFAIDYHGPAKGQGYELWREGLCRSYCRLDPQPFENELIDCRIDFTLLHDVTIATPTGLSARFARTRALLNDGCDDFTFIAASQGSVHVSKDAESVELAGLQGCLLEMNVAASVVLNDAGHFTAARIPRSALLGAVPNAESRLGKPLGENPALVKMIQRYSALCSSSIQHLDVAEQRAAAQHLIDLIALLLGPQVDRTDPVEQRGYSPGRIDLLKAEILDNLTRSNLTIDMIAQGNGLSPRQAQRLFAQSGVTFTEFVLEERLLLAHGLLSDPRHKDRKVSDIAYSSGFGDLSYFNRTFRRRFGITPSEMRFDTGSLR